MFTDENSNCPIVIDSGSCFPCSRSDIDESRKMTNQEESEKKDLFNKHTKLRTIDFPNPFSVNLIPYY